MTPPVAASRRVSARGSPAPGHGGNRVAAWAALAVALAIALAALGLPPAALARPPRLTARAAILIQPSRGIVAYRLHSERELPIASTTKLMTVLLTLERARLGERFRVPRYHAQPAESRAGLRLGERLSVRDLLRAALVASANDAAATLAHGVGGTRARFVREMNRRARALGLRHTHYSTPVGLDQRGNHSSAHDLARLALLLRHNRFFDRTVNMPRAVLRTGDHRRVLRTTDTLLTEVPWVDGIKTGHTIDAGYVLVGSGRRHGLSFVSVVLGEPSEAARDRDTLALLRYGLRRYRIARPLRRGRTVAHATVKGRPGERVALAPSRSFGRVLRRDRRARLAIHAPRQVDGPLPRGAVVGSVDVLVGGRRIARVPLVTAGRVAAPSAVARAGGAVGGPLAIVILAVVAATASLGARRRWTAGHRETGSAA